MSAGRQGHMTAARGVIQDFIAYDRHITPYTAAAIHSLFKQTPASSSDPALCHTLWSRSPPLLPILLLLRLCLPCRAGACSISQAPLPKRQCSRMNGFFHDLPPSLAAVAVSVVGDSTSLRLLDLAELFSQCGPIFHTLQAFEASSQHPSEFALVVFHDKAAAAAACELFMGYPISSTCSLEVQYAPRQALQRLAQMLVKCMQSVRGHRRG